MKIPHERFNYFTIALMACILLLLGGGGFVGYTQYNDIQNFRAALQVEREARDAEQKIASEQLAIASSTILTLQENVLELENDYRKERQLTDELTEEVDDLTGTVRVLDKLSKTDEELLQKYSRVYFLNENYVPSEISQIDEDYILDTRDQKQYFHSDAMPFLEDLMEDARKDDIDLYITSAYRSFEEQSELKGQYASIYGSGANTFSADQGYSEHQLGTTADFSTPAINGPYNGFANTKAYEWLLDNAYKHGFVLSYPEGNQFYVFEPWHWRFVGEDLAKDLNRDDAHFYDWEQRKIDSYLIKIFD